MKDSSSEIFFLPPLAIRLNGSPEKLFPRALLFNFFRQVLIIFNFFFRHRFFMAPLRILILGHSFIRRLHVFLRQNFNEVFARNLHIDGDLSIKWHGIGGRTISKVIRHDLGIVEKFAPEIVVIQLGTNDLSSLSAVETGSALEDLSRLLHESYGVQRVCVCQTIFRSNAPLFNRQVKLLTKYLKVVLEPIPYVLYRRHRGFWNCKSRFLTRDGVHLNHFGQYKSFRSLRGAVLQCLRSLQASG